jgi:hypothetical protein
MKLLFESWKKFMNEGMSYMIPAEWLTREVLDDLANSYGTQSLPKTELGNVIWDKLHDMGVEEISPIKNFKSDSLLHRWIVLDAVNSAESIAQGYRGKAALAATRSWLADPSEENRQVTRRAIIDLSHHTQSTGGYTAYYASMAATVGVLHGYAIVYAANCIAAASSSSQQDARDTALLRFRVLAALDEKGILPEPKV